jgi:hypothetical protein
MSAIAIVHQLTDVGFSSDLWQHVKPHVAGKPIRAAS